LDFRERHELAAEDVAMKSPETKTMTDFDAFFALLWRL
jgi:hypothetical protein